MGERRAKIQWYLRSGFKLPWIKRRFQLSDKQMEHLEKELAWDKLCNSSNSEYHYGFK